MFVYSIPKKRNTIVHVLRGLVPGDAPTNLQLGEFAEVSDKALTLCGLAIVQFMQIEDKPEDMKLCPVCENPDIKEVFVQRAMDKRYEKVAQAGLKYKDVVRPKKKS